MLEDGTLIGLYLLIAGIVMVVFTLAWVVFQKHYGGEVSQAETRATIDRGYCSTFWSNYS